MTMGTYFGQLSLSIYTVDGHEVLSRILPMHEIDRIAATGVHVEERSAIVDLPMNDEPWSVGGALF